MCDNSERNAACEGLPMLLNDRPVSDATAFGFLEIKRTLCRTFLNRDCEPPHAVCIDGVSGSGRTTLMRSMEASLGRASEALRKGEPVPEGDDGAALVSPGEAGTARPCRTLFVNAWKYGDGGDALLAGILEELHRSVPGAAFRQRIVQRLRGAGTKAAGSMAEDVVRRAARAATWLAGKAAGVGGEALEGLATGHLREDVVSAVGDALGEAAGGERPGPDLDAIFRETVSRSASEAQLGFHGRFEECIEDLLGLLLDGERGEILVVFIDDLDRCDAGDVARILRTTRLFLAVRRCIVVIGMEYDRCRRVLEDRLPTHCADTSGEDGERPPGGRPVPEADRDPLETMCPLRIRLSPPAHEDIVSYCEELLERLHLSGVDGLRDVLDARIIPVLRWRNGCQPRFIKKLLNSLSVQLELRRNGRGESHAAGGDLPKGPARDLLIWCVLSNLRYFDRLRHYIFEGDRWAADRLREIKWFLSSRLKGEDAARAGGDAADRASLFPGWSVGDFEVVHMLLEPFEETSIRDCLVYGETVRVSAGQPQQAPGGGDFGPGVEWNAGYSPGTIRAADEEGDDLELELPGGVTLSLGWIPPGEFQMGLEQSPEEAAERFGGEAKGYGDGHPRHWVRITEGFHMGVTPVTQAQYDAVMGRNPSSFRGPERPVESVSWHAAMEFCRRLADAIGREVRLPTEAEWEYACRAGTETAWHCGDDEKELPRYAWYARNSRGETRPVGGRHPNAWGLHDTHGNVFEWCLDEMRDYEEAPEESPVEDPGGPVDDEPPPRLCVLRGGSCNVPASHCRSASRFAYVPSNRNPNMGFRIIVSPGSCGR